MYKWKKNQPKQANNEKNTDCPNRNWIIQLCGFLLLPKLEKWKKMKKGFQVLFFCLTRFHEWRTSMEKDSNTLLEEAKERPLQESWISIFISSLPAENQVSPGVNGERFEGGITFSQINGTYDRLFVKCQDKRKHFVTS